MSLYREPPPPPSKPEPLSIPTRAVWPFALAALLALGAGGFFLFRFLTAPEPLKVLIALEFDGYWWDGSAPSAKLASKLADRLTALGFTPVRNDPETRAILAKAKSPIDGARALHAAFVVTGNLTPALIEHPVAGGYFELRSDAPIEVRHVRDDAGTVTRVTAFAGSRARADGPKLLADALADKAFDAVLGGVAKHPSIATLFEGHGGDPILAGKVTPAREYVKARDRRLRQAAAFTDELELAHKQAEKGPVPVTYHGPFTAQDQLSGAGPGGYLVKSNDVTPFFSPDTLDLTYYEALEAVEWRAPDGPKKTLWSGYHVFSYAAAAPEGAPAVFVEDLFGWAKTITAVDGAGASKRLRIDPEHRYTAPKVAPSGTAAALYDRACRTCDDGLLVIALGDGSTLWKTDPEEGALAGFAWIDRSRLAFGQLPPGAFQPVIRVVDVGSKPATVTKLIDSPKGEHLVVSAGDPVRGKIAVEIRGTARERLGIVDTASGRLDRHDVGGVAAFMSFSPDGKRVAFELTPNDAYLHEIGVLDLDTGKARRLTDNPWEDHYPVFSGDGARIYYETRARDRTFATRSISVIASVPAR